MNDKTFQPYNLPSTTPIKQTPIQYTSEAITVTTLAVMNDLIKAAKGNLTIGTMAQRLIQNVRSKDSTAEIKSLENWIGNNINLSNSTNQDNKVQAPLVTLKEKYANSKDIAVLAATMLKAVGFKCRLVTVGKSKPELVFVEALSDEKWVDVAPSKMFKFAPNPSGTKRFQIWELE